MTSSRRHSSPITILDLRDSPWVDGPGRTVLDTAASLESERYSLIVGSFCCGDPAESEYLSEASDRSLRTQPILEDGALDLKVIPQVLRAVDRHNVDIIHAHDFRSNVVGYFCARRRRIPVVSTCHGWITNDLKGRVKKRLDLRLLSRFDRIITVSRRLKQEVVAGGVNDRLVDVIVNALVLGRFRRPDSGTNDFRQRLGIADDACLIANIGRLSAEKGQALLLHALSNLRDSGTKLEVVLVGIGPDEPDLRSLVKQKNLCSVVKFAGYCDDMPAVYSSADVVVQSSLTEGMPNVILESLLMETPVIATDVGGTAEIVEHGHTGYLIPANSIESIENGILDFLKTKKGHYEMASQGRKVIVKTFDNSARAEKIAHIYSSVMRSGQL